jgi:hypothetical protein
MRAALSQTDLKNLESAIYFLKVTELKQICEKFNQCHKGSKQDLINTLLAFARGDDNYSPNKQISAAEQALRDNANSYDPGVYLVPGVYTNNKASRAILLELIGRHFTFTSYGMDWIKAQWHEGNCPSYLEFADYWQTEYQKRKNRDDFASKQTLKRVNFFREMKGENLSKQELEKAWAVERAKQATTAFSLFSKMG